MTGVSDPIERILSRLEVVKRAGNQWLAKCPAHEDSNASLSLTRGDDGRVLLHCFAGCSTKEICGAIGITEADLFAGGNGHQPKAQIIATYDYRDETGTLLYQAVRYSPKEFKQRRPDGTGGYVWNMKGARLVPYRLPELIAADAGAVVFIVEGEKDADRLAQAGLVATCNVGGAGKWKDSYNDHLRGQPVAIIADKDAPGRKHARQVACSLSGVAARIVIIELPGEGVKDASDWFGTGGTAEKLIELVEQSARFDPRQAQDPQGVEQSARFDPRQAQDPQREATGARVDDRGSDKGEKKEERLSQRQLLVKLAEHVELWHDGDTAYATITVEGHRENHPVNSKGFRCWLVRRFWLAVNKVPGGQAVQDALGVLMGKALYEGEQRTVAVRVAENEGAIYLDLAGEDWQVVKVTVQGWQLLDNPPVMFIRRRGMLPLPTPMKGGSVNELRTFINVREDRDFVLIVAWLLAAVRGRGPYPVQALYGEQGSCKSTAQKMQRALVDPNKSPLRSEPKEPRDLMIAASNSQVVGFDNLSNVPNWLSQTMCRLSTGGGFSTRELYSDADEMIFEAMRPQMFNGIQEVATRPDLLDRSVLITLMPISEADRKPEDELWGAFHEARPRILGAILDAAAAGLANIGAVKLDRLPRMADFAKWATACEPGLGWKEGTFMDAYLGNRAAANDCAIESSAIGLLMVKLMENRDSLTGTAKELMEAVEGMLPKDRNDHAKLPAGWPKSPRGFSGELRRIAPNLRATGVDVTFGTHTKKGTPIRLERQGETPSPSSPPSPASQDSDLRGDGRGDGDADRRSRPSPGPSPHKPSGDNGHDEGDGGDGEFPDCSKAERTVVRL